MRPRTKRRTKHLLLPALCCMAACGPAPAASGQAQPGKDQAVEKNHERKLVVKQGYLLLPIDNGAPKATLRLEVDGREVRHLAAELARLQAENARLQAKLGTSD